MIPEWVQKDGETFYDSRVVDQQSATEIYGEGATYRPNGYEFVSSERDNIELGDSGSFRRNGEIHTSEDRAKEALENQSVNTTQVPSGNGYFDFNLSFGSHGLGLTGGVMVDSNRNEFPYFGGGFMTPGFGRSVGYSPDTVSTGYNAQLQAIIGGGGSLGVDSRGNSFTEFNAGSSSASATLFFVFGGDETILPQTYSDPTGPNAGVNSPLDYNRPVRRNCACNPMP